jgi:hypothetical protein
MAKIAVLRDQFFMNNTSSSVELMVAPGESVEVFAPDNRTSYVVVSTEAEQQSVTLLPGEHLSLR